MMKLNTPTTAVYTLFTLLTLLSSVFSFPLSMTMSKRDVYVPPILKPDNTSIWVVGSTFNVTWNTTNPPAQITNRQGRIALGKSGLIFVNETGGLNDPLAQGFDILNGVQEISVPDVEDGDDYFIVLFGDSGNWSQNFTITHTAPTTTTTPEGDVAGSDDGSNPALDEAHAMVV